MTPEEDLILVFIPSLVSRLLAAEKQKGSPLTQAEVESTRDRATCVALPMDVAAHVCESRGYDDIDPEQAWEAWQVVRLTLINPDSSSASG